MGSVKEHMASKLKSARKEKGLSVDQVGEAVGKSGKTISAWEVGRGQPNGDELLTICKLLEISLADLWAPRGSVEYAVVSLDDRDYVERPVLGESADVHLSHPCPKAIADRHPNSSWVLVGDDGCNRSIYKGCYALIDLDSTEPKDGSLFAVNVDGRPTAVRRVKRLANGYELIPNSYDPTYMPIVYNYNKEGTEKVTVEGEVVYASFPLDWEF